MTSTCPRRWTRRALLEGLGAGAALAPFVPLLAGDAQAQPSGLPKRLIVFFHPNGYGVKAQYFPQNATENDFTLGPILKPLEPHKANLIVFEGINNPGGVEPFGYVHIPHTGSLLTGVPLARGSIQAGFGWSQGPSVDQYVAQQIGAGTPFRSLELHAVGGRDRTEPQTRICYAGPDKPVTGERDPKLALQRIVNVSVGGTGGDLDLRRRRSERRSAIDFVKADLARLRQRVGREDLARIDGHQSAVRELETQLAGTTEVNARACRTEVAFGTLEPLTGSATYPARVKAHIDVLVRALACDATRVGTLQMANNGGSGGATFTWFGQSKDEHLWSHTPGAEIVQVKTWYMEQLAYLVSELKKVPEGSGTLFDSTMILVCSEHGNAAAHDNRSLPFLLVGNARGAFKTGRYLKYSSVPNNQLLVSVCHAMGLSVDSFGLTKYGTGPLTGLA